jgi:hypothetical protein
MLGIMTSTPLTISNSNPIFKFGSENDAVLLQMIADTHQTAASCHEMATRPQGDRHALNNGGGGMGTMVWGTILCHGGC